ncbi:Methyltransferase-like protein 23 [Actinomortierella wolfii]|nr:Methyltransferase-like protein 23 [Actinomortierella wolfii]
MAEYLYTNRLQFQGTPESPKIVLELGSGTALPSLLLGKLSQATGGATHIITTDRVDAPQILDNIKQAMAENGIGHLTVEGNSGASTDDVIDHPMQVCELAWGDFSPSPGGLSHVLQAVEKVSQIRGGVPRSGRVDFLIGSDTFYHPPDFEPLLATVSYVIHRHNPECVFITTYQDRSAKRSIAHLLDKWGLEAQIIDWDEFGFDMDKYVLEGAHEDIEGSVDNDVEPKHCSQDNEPRQVEQQKRLAVMPLVDYSSGSDSESDTDNATQGPDQAVAADRIKSVMQQSMSLCLQPSPQALPSSEKKESTPATVDHRIADSGSLSSVVLILIRKRRLASEALSA